MSSNILEYLEASEAAHHDRCAVIDDGRSYSYHQLAEACRRVGSSLARIGVRGHGVMVSMEKSFNALVAQLGILYAGGFYVPVDPEVPAGRLETIASALGHPFIICDEESEEVPRLQFAEACVLSYETLCNGDIDYDALRSIRESVLETEPAYTLFTSGSTGKPKGVCVSHRAIVSFIDAFVKTTGVTETDVIANQAPFDFDVSTKDVYVSLAASATLVIIPRKLFIRPIELVKYMELHRVTVLIWAVAALCLISTFHASKAADLSSIRMVLFSGEVMPIKHLEIWRATLPRATFVNLYGPTEVTCNCLYHVLDPSRTYEEGMPLGKPFPHCDVILVDDENRVVHEPGVEGELLVRGPSLAIGYLGDPELTSQSFVQNPTHDDFPDRVYRTGDTAVLNSLSELVFHGRKDNQVKYQGHRIELEEIDIALERLPGVDRCRCVFDPDRRRLIACYEGDATVGELNRAARATLPSFMRPTCVRRVDDMPLNKNGKVDRAQLLALVRSNLRLTGKHHAD